jgi:hypothetical protein
MVAPLQARITALETKLAGVSTENGGDDFVFTDVNVHVRNGSGATFGSANGRGNLIVGYNELRGGGNDKSGSHNLVIGPYHNYSSYGGLVAGYRNVVSGAFSSVSGGRFSTADDSYCSVSGGESNQATSSCSSVSGGYANIASGSHSSVSGGQNNTAKYLYTSVSGGRNNEAGQTSDGDNAHVCGGNGNLATADDQNLP